MAIEHFFPRNYNETVRLWNTHTHRGAQRDSESLLTITTEEEKLEHSNLAFSRAITGGQPASLSAWWKPLRSVKWMGSLYHFTE